MDSNYKIMAIMFLRSEHITLTSLKKLKICTNNTLVAGKMKSTGNYMKYTSVSQISKITVFRDVMPCSLIDRYQHFRELALSLV
jgi:hypothetical protein